jgi:hypothetical protein
LRSSRGSPPRAGSPFFAAKTAYCSAAIGRALAAWDFDLKRGGQRVGTAAKTAQIALALTSLHPIADERTEIVGQLHRSLALLRGCNAPGARAQIGSLVASLAARLHHLEASASHGGKKGRLSRLIPSTAAFELQPLECRSYAIQCESLASMAASDQRQMLLALARLWRALADAQRRPD